MLAVQAGGRGKLVDIKIARLNIEHNRKKLAVEQDEATRQRLMRLLAEEETKLAAFDNPPKRKRRT